MKMSEIIDIRTWKKSF